MNDRSRSAAFTLIELLVTIAILTLLIGILVPSLSSARRQAKANACLSTVKGLGMGFTIYLTENRDEFPPVKLKNWRPSDPTAPEYVNEYNCRQPRWQWFLKLDSGPPIEPTQRMLRKPGGWGDEGEGAGPNDRTGRTLTNDTFLCPALDDPEYERDVRNGAFGYNYQYLGNSRQDTIATRWDNFSVGLHQISATSGTVLIADSRGGGRKHGVHSFTLDPPRRATEKNAARFGPIVADLSAAGLDPDPVYAFSPVSNRHNNRGNVIFVDGHGESLTQIELGYEIRPEDNLPIPIHETSEGTMWNNKMWTGTNSDPKISERAQPTP